MTRQIDSTELDAVVQLLADPREHWTRIRTNNPLERIMREIRRRTRVVGAFPDGRSALMLAAARLRHVAGTRWGTRKYLDMERLRETDSNSKLNAAPQMGESHGTLKSELPQATAPEL